MCTLRKYRGQQAENGIKYKDIMFKIPNTLKHK